MAVVTSLVSLASQASNPAVYEVVRKPGTNVFRRRSEEHPGDERQPGLLLIRVEGQIFFGNVERVLDLVASGRPSAWRSGASGCSSISSTRPRGTARGARRTA